MAIGTAHCHCAYCGAEFEVRRDHRNRRTADEWVEYAEHYYDKCPACYRAEKEKERAEKRAEDDAKAAKINASVQFPALTGTPKQIAWAEKIRAMHWELQYNDLTDEYQADGGQILKDMIFDKITDSKEWIEKWRDTTTLGSYDLFKAYFPGREWAEQWAKDHGKGLSNA